MPSADGQPARTPVRLPNVTFWSNLCNFENPVQDALPETSKEANMPPSHWPADERPRERLLTHGPESLSDAELLAIFLRTGTTGMPVMALARHLITEFSGLRGLMTASRRQFCEVKGLGTAKYAQVQAAMEMARRVMDEPLRQGDPLRSPEDTRRFLTSRLGTYCSLWRLGQCATVFLVW